jgi:hypothetical protein
MTQTFKFIIDRTCIFPGFLFRVDAQFDDKAIDDRRNFISSSASCGG